MAKSQAPHPPVMTHEAILGSVLKRHRELRSIDQGLMAQRVGVTQPYWSKVELGRANPSMGVVRKACEVLGVSEAELHSQIEQVRQGAQARGVKIISTAEESTSDWMPFVAGAAIGALIALVLTKKK